MDSFNTLTQLLANIEDAQSSEQEECENLARLIRRNSSTCMHSFTLHYFCPAGDPRSLHFFVYLATT